VVMDNLSAHRPKRVRELIEQQGCELIYLPSYSPEYTIRSKRRLPRSRTTCAKPQPGAKRL
jgi:transposase